MDGIDRARWRTERNPEVDEENIDYPPPPSFNDLIVYDKDDEVIGTYTGRRYERDIRDVEEDAIASDDGAKASPIAEARFSLQRIDVAETQTDFDDKTETHSIVSSDMTSSRGGEIRRTPPRYATRVFSPTEAGLSGSLSGSPSGSPSTPLVESLSSRNDDVDEILKSIDRMKTYIHDSRRRLREPRTAK